MNNHVLRFLSDADFDKIHATFLEAFADYVIPFQPSKADLAELFTRRGADLSLSVGAFDDQKLIAFHVNACEDYGGILTAYDVVTGIIPAYRARGLARSLFDFCVPSLKQRGAKRYLLEVIESNTRAVKAYQKVGFEKERELKAFRKKPEAPRSHNYGIEQIALDWHKFPQFWSWQPSWQNSIQSINRSKREKRCLGIFRDGQLTGYGIVYPESGDIPQFAVDPLFRYKGAGSALFDALLAHVSNPNGARVVNVDVGHQESIAFFEKHNWEMLTTQWEMSMPLSGP